MPWMWPNSIGRPAGFLFCFGTKKAHSNTSSKCFNRNNLTPMLKKQQMYRKDITWSLCPKRNVAAADSSALQTPVEINEVISETLKQRAKEFMNLPLPLLTVHRQIFSKRSFVLPQCCELFANFHRFSRQLKGWTHSLEDLLFEWSLFIQPRWEFIQKEITARNISLFM